MKNARKFAIGTVLAAAAGYVAGILTAPKSGKETRQDIKNAAERAISEAEKRLKALHTELTQLLKDARVRLDSLKGKAQEELQKALSTATEAKEKARDLLSAAHDGVADDKELKKAIEEANKAIEHLKKYLIK